MDSLGRSRSLSKYSRSRNSSNSKITPNVAAAMLSLRWPPPQKPRGESDYDDSDVDDRRPGALKRSNSRKLYQKSKSSTNGNGKNNNNNDEPVEYEPVTIPQFHEVHTAWPGFDHEPVPNWEEKYMIAKPYPKTVADVSSKSSYINYGNDLPLVSSSKETSLKRDAKLKVRSKNRVVGEARQTFENPVDPIASRPKRIIRLERVGSCIT